MLSKAILDTANELTRHAQSTKPQHNELREQLAKLQRATALQSPDPRAAVLALRNHVGPHFPNTGLYDGVTARVLDLIETHDSKPTRDDLRAALDRLVDEVVAAPAELADQLSAMLRPGDRLVVLAEPPAQPIETAIVDALTQFRSTPATGTATTAPSLHVSVLHAGADDGVAVAMATRLRGRGVEARAIHVGQLAGALGAASKTVLPVLAGDPDDGLLCLSGAAALAGLSVRASVPVIAATARHALQPGGNSGMAALAAADAAPGAVWEYEAARDDRKRDAVVIVAPRFDLVPLQKVDTVVSDGGAFAGTYVVNVVPNLEKREAEQGR